VRPSNFRRSRIALNSPVAARTIRLTEAAIGLHLRALIDRTADEPPTEATSMPGSKTSTAADSSRPTTDARGLVGCW